MNINELSKSQFVLLVLLVCFVTSIATGIVTVTLLEEAPEAITTKIDRIVERTVERVIPGETSETKTPYSRETVVSEIFSRAITLYFSSGEIESDPLNVIGFVVSQNKILVPDINLPSSVLVLNYKLNETEYELTRDIESPFPLFTFKEVEGTALPEIPKALPEVSRQIRIGESLLVVAVAPDRINEGIVSSIASEDSLSYTVSILDNEKFSHALLFTLEGELIGVRTGEEMFLDIRGN